MKHLQLAFEGSVWIFSASGKETANCDNKFVALAVKIEPSIGLDGSVAEKYFRWFSALIDVLHKRKSLSHMQQFGKDRLLLLDLLCIVPRG